MFNHLSYDCIHIYRHLNMVLRVLELCRGNLYNNIDITKPKRTTFAWVCLNTNLITCVFFTHIPEVKFKIPIFITVTSLLTEDSLWCHGGVPVITQSITTFLILHFQIIYNSTIQSNPAWWVFYCINYI